MSIVITEDRGAVRHVVMNRPREAQRDEPGADRRARRGAARGGGRFVGPVRRRARRRSDVLCRDGHRLAGLARRQPRRLRARNVILHCANLCEEMAKPTICQIHGGCIGGAMELALACDLRAMASTRRSGWPRQVRAHSRRRRLLAPARGRRARPRQGDDHDLQADRRRRGASGSGWSTASHPRSSSTRPPTRWSRSCSRARPSRSAWPSACSTPPQARAGARPGAGGHRPGVCVSGDSPRARAVAERAELRRSFAAGSAVAASPPAALADNRTVVRRKRSA